MPKILVTSINFAPDHAGIGVYSTDFPVYLAEQGHMVTMVTGFSYYPAWRKRDEDHGRLFARESYRGVEVYRGYLYVPLRASALFRSWHEFTFCAFAAVNLLRAGRHDVIVVFSPPFFLGLVALAVGRFWHRPVVINVQDLPLDGAVALGMIRTGLFTRFLRWAEGCIYRRADAVVTISPVMLENLRSKGVKEDRLSLVPNWIDVGRHQATGPAGQFLRAHPIAAGKLTVAYAGNLGVKQGVDSLLHLAERCKRDGTTHFFIIGDGADRRRLEELASRMALPNLTFLPFMAPDQYRAMLQDVDVIFVAQRSGAGNNFFPSKLLGLMAQAKTLLIAADEDSELAKEIRATGCGLVSAYDDIPGLAANLESLRSDPIGRVEMGARGRVKVAQYDRNRVLGEWTARILRLFARAG